MMNQLLLYINDCAKALQTIHQTHNSFHGNFKLSKVMRARERFIVRGYEPYRIEFFPEPDRKDNDQFHIAAL